MPVKQTDLGKPNNDPKGSQLAQNSLDEDNFDMSDADNKSSGSHQNLNDSLSTTSEVSNLSNHTNLTTASTQADVFLK